MNITSKLVVLGLTAAILSITLVSPADAASLRLYDGTNTEVINDNNVFPDLSPATGSIVAVVFAFGVWDVTVTSSATKPLIGSATSPLLDIYVDAFSHAAGNLEVSFSETFFGTSGVDASAYPLAGIIAPSATVDYATFQDPSNGLFAQTNTLTSRTFGPGLITPNTPVDSGTLLPNAAYPYSLTQVVTIHHTGAQESSFQGELRVTKENVASVPDGGSSVALLGLGLVAVEGLRRKLIGRHSTRLD